MTCLIPRPGDPRERTVTLVGPGGTVTGRLRWELVGNDYKVTLDGPTGRLEATDRDYFEALTQLRLRLEPDGWRVAVQGARLNTYASGALRDQGGARKVYVLEMGRPAQRADRVNIFDDAADDLATVAEQRAFTERWRDSVRGDTAQGPNR